MITVKVVVRERGPFTQQLHLWSRNLPADARFRVLGTLAATFARELRTAIEHGRAEGPGLAAITARRRAAAGMRTGPAWHMSGLIKNTVALRPGRGRVAFEVGFFPGQAARASPMAGDVKARDRGTSMHPGARKLGVVRLVQMLERGATIRVEITRRSQRFLKALYRGHLMPGAGALGPRRQPRGKTIKTINVTIPARPLIRPTIERFRKTIVGPTITQTLQRLGYQVKS